MKKAVKSVFVLILIVSTVFFSISSYFIFTSDDFNTENVVSSIAYLSSDSLGGRLAGTMENAMAGDYIKKQLKDIGIESFTDEDYYQSFDIVYPKKTDGKPSLNVYDNNNCLVKSYGYGTDYKDIFQNFKVASNSFSGRQSIKGSDKNILLLQSDKGSALFLTPANNDFSFRSSFFPGSTYDLYIYISDAAMGEIISFLNSGFTVSVSFPYTNADTSIKNVVGVIKGSDSSLPPIIISAHFDHVGTDCSGTIYNGALDNASGASFALELARYLKTLDTPERDIIFAFFNAEEFGLKGSEAFAAKYGQQLSGAEVFNFDMIGSDDGIPLCIIDCQTGNASDKLVTDVVSMCKSNNVHYNCKFEDSSDHASFGSLGIDAVTICDNDIGRIHIPDDTIDYIKPSAINRCASVILPVISNECRFSNYTFIRCRYAILITSVITASVCIIVLILFSKKSESKNA